jgi:hypothetical protein
MASQVDQVKAGYAALDSYDRLKVRQFIEEFEKKSGTEQKSMNESFNSAVRNKSLGPTSSAACPCCGR